MSRRERPVTEPTECRSCSREVLWVEWPRSGKRMPVDANPDPTGTVVLTLRKGPPAALLAEKFDERTHGSKRNRYTSHFATCPGASEWRKKDAGGAP